MTACLLTLTACDGTISVTFQTGPLEFEVSSSEVDLPTELESDTGTIAAIPCGPMGMCPPSDVVTLTCVDNACDPAPRTVTVPAGSAVDIASLLASARTVGLSQVDAYDFGPVEYQIASNNLTVPLNPIEVYWAPASATTIDPAMGVHHFGTIPAIGAGQTGPGSMVIDGEGAGQLSDYLTGSGTSIRFFAQTMVDLNPGDPFPSGGIRMSVNASVTAVGSLVP